MERISLDDVYDDLRERLVASMQDTGISVSMLRDLVRGLSNSDHLPTSLTEMIDLAAGSMKSILLSVLADATRDVPYWRSAFGLGVRCTRYQGSTFARANSDCVLDAARRVTAGLTERSGVITGEQSDQCSQALRIIANCCADDNINRSLIIYRGGILDLIELLSRNPQLTGVLIPALYNVVSDFDEEHIGDTCPTPVSENHHDVQDAEIVPISVAEHMLSALHTRSGYHAVQVLLDTVDTCPVSTAPFLADLLSMSTMPVVCEGGLGCSSYAGCVRLLCHKAQHLSRLHQECFSGTFQAILNFASEQSRQNDFLDPKCLLDLLDFRQLLYTYSLGRDEHAAAYEEAFLKMIYELSSKPRYQEIAADTDLLTLSDKDHFAEFWVLVCNGVSSAEQARSLVRDLQVQEKLPEILASNSNQVILPAIKLATKLALFPENQPEIWEAGITGMTSRFFASTKYTPEIQHEAVTLLRMILRGRPEYISAVFFNPATIENSTTSGSPVHAALRLFKTTNDSAIKLEVGRLITGIFRTLSSPGTPIEYTNAIELFFTPTPAFAQPMAFLAQEGPSEAARGEGWFGLALMSQTTKGAQAVVDILSPASMLQLLRKTPDRNGNFLIAKLAGMQSLTIAEADRDALNDSVRALTIQESTTSEPP